MIDIYIDEVDLTMMPYEKDNTRLDFINKKKDEHIHMVMNDEELVRMYVLLKNRCEIKGLIKVSNADRG